MERVAISDRAGLPAGRLRALERELAGAQTLAEALRWGRAQSPPAEVSEVVTQDEFTHDVVLHAAGEGVYLVFDTT
jgi:hypothetical protein